jgi:hypothetical protein
MSDLIISPAARSTLNALASIQDQSGANRIASGKHTNVPTEYPTSYVLPAGLAGRASAIGALTNDISHAPDAKTFSTSVDPAAEARADFNQAIVNTLNAGADVLTVNDPAADSAALLALQTRQQLAAASLSLTAGGDASALRLFGF